MHHNKNLCCWRHQIIGQKCEVYWSPPDPTTDKSSCESVDDPNLDSDYEADWYDAFIQGYDEEKNVFRVSFVGDINVYVMPLEKNKVRMIHHDDQQPNTKILCLCYICCGDYESSSSSKSQEEQIIFRSELDYHHHHRMQSQKTLNSRWISHVVGKDWEVFWQSSPNSKSNSNSTSCGQLDVKDDHSQSDDSSFYSDWYDAHILSFCHHSCTFQVAFVGDEGILCSMYLEPHQVRPAARNWVQRSMALLKLNVAEIELVVPDQENSSRINTNKMKSLQEIESQILPMKITIWKEEDSEKDLCGNDDLLDFDLCLYQRLLQDQLFTRSLLSFTHDKEEDYKSSKKVREPAENSNQHVDYLAYCIQHVIKACQWHSSHVEANSFSRRYLEQHQKSSVEDLYIEIITGLVLLMKAMSMDWNLRSRNVHNISNKNGGLANSCSIFTSTSRKRRKIRSNKRFDIYAEEPKDAMIQKELSSIFDWDEIRIEDVKSLNSCKTLWTHFINCFQNSEAIDTNLLSLSESSIRTILENLNKNHSTYYVHEISSGIFQHHIHCWSVITEWITSTKSILGEKYCPKDSLQFAFQMDEVEDAEASSFHLVDIQRLLEESKTGVLRKFNLFSYTEALKQKIRDIRQFQQDAWDVLMLIPYSNVDDISDEGTDSLVTQLEDLKLSPLCPTPEDERTSDFSTISSDDLTSLTIEKALTLRRWMIRCHRACQRRERVIEYEILRETYPDGLAFLTNSTKPIVHKESKLEMLICNLQLRQNEIAKLDPKTESYPLCDNDHIISEVRERFTIIQSVDQWRSRVESSGIMNDGASVDCEILDGLHKDLLLIKKGICDERSILVKDLRRNEDVEQMIVEFAHEYIQDKAGALETKLLTSYEESLLWRNRSDNVLRLLAHHGNEYIPDNRKLSVPEYKCPQFVQQSSIEQLIQDHENFSFCVPSTIRCLKETLNSCKRWIDRMDHIFHERSSSDDEAQVISPFNVLQQLDELSTCRPRGILLIPSEESVSKWTDLLKWYRDCSKALEHLSYLHEQKEQRKGEEESNTLELAKINADIDRFVVQGYELIMFSSSTNQNGFKIDFNDDDLSFFMHCFNNSHNMKVTNQKFSSEDLKGSSTIVSKLIQYDESLLNKGVLFKMQLFLWKKIPSHIMSNAWKSRLKDFNIMQPTIQNATAALMKLDTLPMSITDLSERDFFAKSVYSSRILPLQSLIIEASETQKQSFSILTSLDCNSYEPSNEWIQASLDQIRIMRNKVRSINSYGLKLDSDCLSSLEKRYKDLHWLAKAWPIQTIRNLERVVHRVRHHQLLSILEKAPSISKQHGGVSESGLNIILMNAYQNLIWMSEESLRWLEDVKGFLPPSASKTKAQRSVKSIYGSYDSSSDFSVVNERVIYNLLSSDIIQLVEMDEEIALRESYRKTLELKNEMHEIFRVDQLGNDVDRTTLPEYESLIGLDGTFYLKKVTGSPEYMELNEKIESISSSAIDLPVKTLEKITYDWIHEVLKWTLMISSSLQYPKEHSAFNKISISLKDATVLIENGNDLFFHGLTDDIKKYLSLYKVSISPRVTSQRVHVNFNKGGSIHSMGGTVLRWIAFLFNALQQDLSRSLHWSKVTRGHLAKDESPDDESNLGSLLNQLYDLVVVPEEDLVRQLWNRLGFHEGLLKQRACESNPVFHHQLLNHVSEHK